MCMAHFPNTVLSRMAREFCDCLRAVHPVYGGAKKRAG
jgi:hypothetical protein